MISFIGYFMVGWGVGTLMSYDNYWMAGITFLGAIITMFNKDG